MAVARRRRPRRPARSLLAGVLPDRLQQPVARLVRPPPRPATSDLSPAAPAGPAPSAPRSPSPAHDRLGRLQRPAAGEDRQPAQQHPLRLGQQVVAPVDRRPQRLLARQRPSGCRRSAGGSGRPAGRRSARPTAPQPRRRQLDRQRDAVQPPADLAPRPARSSRSARSRGCDGAAPARRRGGTAVVARERRRSGRCLSGPAVASDGTRQTVSPATPSALAAGGQDAQAGAAPQQRLGQRGAGVEQVLAVVEHQQQAPGGQRRRSACRRAAGPAARARRARAATACGHERRVGQRRQLDQPDAVRVVGRPARRRLQRQARLADAAGAGQRQQPRRRQQRARPRPARARARRSWSAPPAGWSSRLRDGAGRGVRRRWRCRDLADEDRGAQVVGGLVRLGVQLAAQRRGRLVVLAQRQVAPAGLRVEPHQPAVGRLVRRLGATARFSAAIAAAGSPRASSSSASPSSSARRSCRSASRRPAAQSSSASSGSRSPA